MDENTSYDRVIVTDSNYDMLLEWGNSRNLNSVSIFDLKKPFVNLYIEHSSGAYFEVHLEDRNLYQIKAFSPEKILVNDFQITHSSDHDILIKNDLVEQKFKSIFKNIDYVSECGDVTYLIKCLMNYISEYREERTRIKREVQTSTRIKKAKKQVLKKRIKIGVYYINDYDEPISLKKYQKHLMSWGVRGHWRQYKSGKKVWVTPHNKGIGEKEGKEYRID